MAQVAGGILGRSLAPGPRSAVHQQRDPQQCPQPALQQPLPALRQRFEACCRAGGASPAEALALFDALPPLPPEAMLGHWRGEGFATGHGLDGLLEAYHWHGKRFDSLEHVHPLVFRGPRGRLRCIDPAWMGPGLALVDRLPGVRSGWAGRLFQRLSPLAATDRSRARLRATEHRGQVSATMLYDQLPINDVFRRVDDDTVFGLMDRKGDPTPFFFILRRCAPPSP
jgi:hypothetical protein